MKITKSTRKRVFIKDGKIIILSPDPSYNESTMKWHFVELLDMELPEDWIDRVYDMEKSPTFDKGRALVGLVFPLYNEVEKTYRIELSKEMALKLITRLYRGFDIAEEVYTFAGTTKEQALKKHKTQMEKNKSNRKSARVHHYANLDHH